MKRAKAMTRAGLGWCLTMVLAWGAFAFGSVYEWAYTVLAAGAVVLGLTAVLLTRKSAASRVPAPVLFSLLGVHAVLLLQLVPLPPWMLDAVSPRATHVLRQLDVAYALAPGWHPLSITPSATATALLLFAAFTLMLMGTTRIVPLIGPKRIAGILVGIGSVLALDGVLQRPLFGAEIYGVWTPEGPGSVFGPFVNKNHFAGWMVMALPVALGWLCAAFTRVYAADRRTWRDRLVWLSSPAANRLVLGCLAIVLMTFSLFWTLSRSGIIAFAIASVITSVSLLRRREAGARRWLGVAFLVATIALVVGAVGTETLTARFDNGDASTLNMRLPIWQDASRIVREFPLFGSGVNSFGQMMLLYQTTLPDAHVREAHNDYVQLVAEGGVVLALVVLVAAVMFMRAVRARFRASHGSTYWIRLGAVTGLIAVAIQSAVEFSLQMPGNFALFVALAAIALHEDRRQSQPPSRPPERTEKTRPAVGGPAVLRLVPR